MSESVNINGAATKARVIASALALGRSLDVWSLVFVAMALFGLLWAPLSLASVVCLLLSIALGGIQKVFALRVAFDEALFRHWAEAWTLREDINQTILASDLATLDQSLFACGLIPEQGGVVRDLDSRLQGAMRLLKKQIVIFVIQFVAIVGAVVPHL